ncbi:4-azaleucine resistance transporter AzlC [Hydrogenispora ethanolica]|uniref:4-azaleucine resistance transporter AzlC n=1 Tax=Hydrogenispora ethanolica TaxID=1082276 RepID=A0A4R1SBN1_HYDET|nr:AzlC family ABC transporter permease [Hydrogenispora ethanolica]TCL76420.1 4-azaleucine resistance transporter AzlC [Hydrogenispora ethanolica]
MKETLLGGKEGWLAGAPVVIGYFPVAMAFGLLAKAVHVPLLEACLFSLIVFAGASQFMALDLLRAGVATGGIVAATLLLNLRHLMMSASLAVRLGHVQRHWLPWIAFGITDESFAVASLQQGTLSVPYLLALQGSAYGAWAGGTGVGYLLGAVLPGAVQSSLGVGLYAMFAALLVPEFKKSAAVRRLAVLAGMIYALLEGFRLLPPSWRLIATIVAATAAGLWRWKDGSAAEETA